MGYLLHSFHVIKHKFWVMLYICSFCLKMLWRGFIHDKSKFRLDEGCGYGKTIGKLCHVEYGSKENQKLLEESKTSRQLHYSRNSHHPEHYPYGIEGMSLEDFVEMFCDWKAAVRKHKNGDIQVSIETNCTRFSMQTQSYALLKNSIGKKSCV